MLTNYELNTILEDAKFAIQEKKRLKLKKTARTKPYQLCTDELQFVFRDEISNKSRAATKDDYMAWLKIYLENGGKITHIYNYKMDIHDWIIVTKDVEITPLYGAGSKNIIIADGVKVKCGNIGHNKLFFMDGYTKRQLPLFVPIYTDTIFDEIEDPKRTNNIIPKLLSRLRGIL